jgi:glycosyltransferase involved in cell wall biosynthesis
MASPRITIGLPIYNNERNVAESLTSLLGQTYGDFVLLVCDNASTDRTGEIVQEFARRDARVVYHRNPRNIGMFPNFNRVFELTKTPYLKWATGDDYWSPQFLAEALPIIEADASIGAVYPKATFVDFSGKTLSLYEDKVQSLQDDPVARFRTVLDNIRRVHVHLGLLRTSMIARTRLFGAYQGGDISFVADMALYGKLHEMPERYFFRRFHEESSSWNRHDAAHQAKRFNPGNSKGGKFDYVRLYSDYFIRVIRSDLSAAQKAAAVNYLTHRTYWDREVLYRDIGAGLRRAVR